MADRLRQLYDAARDVRHIDPWTWARPVAGAGLVLATALAVVSVWRAGA